MATVEACRWEAEQIWLSGDLAKYAEKIHRQLEKREEKHEEESDEELIEKLALKERVDKAKPLKARMIENLSWYGNLIQDLGKTTIFRLLDAGLVKLDEEDYYNYERAREKFFSTILDLVKAKDDAIKLMELEDEIRLLEAEHELLQLNVDKLREVIEVAVKSLCDECRRRFFRKLALSLVFKEDFEQL